MGPFVVALLLLGTAHADVKQTLAPTPSPKSCVNETLACNKDMAENIGETVRCDPCVCIHAESTVECEDSNVCEVRAEFPTARGIEPKVTYNCALAPDRTACIPSIAECMSELSNRTLRPTGFKVCDNCVCRDVEGVKHCASTDDCVAICNPESGCNPLTDPHYAYDCVPKGCGESIETCFALINTISEATHGDDWLDRWSQCDKCVCENVKHYCSEGDSCIMRCDDPNGCYSFASTKIRYGCDAAPVTKQKSKLGVAIGACFAVIAALCVGAVIYYKRSIEPRLSRVPGGNVLDDPLVSDQELKEGTLNERGGRSVAATNNAVGVGQSDYNEL
jgi:hypothetical protein